MFTGLLFCCCHCLDLNNKAAKMAPNKYNKKTQLADSSLCHHAIRCILEELYIPKRYSQNNSTKQLEHISSKNVVFRYDLFQEGRHNSYYPEKQGKFQQTNLVYVQDFNVNWGKMNLIYKASEHRHSFNAKKPLYTLCSLKTHAKKLWQNYGF